MENLLKSATEITSVQYMSLVDPVFKAQTRPDENGMYWMVFEDSGVIYKTHNNLFA